MTNESLPQNFLHYCPHCGSADFAPAGGKQFRCGACGFSFFTNSAAAVAALIVDEAGRLMLTRRACEPWRGMLDLPGGFVDPDESAEEALRRELAEELGAQVAEMRYFGSSHNRYVFSGYTVFTTDLAFVCRLAPGAALAAADDVDSYVWLAPADIDLQTIGAPSIRSLVRQFAGAGLNRKTDPDR